MSDAIFNLGLLKNYQIVDGPGTFPVTVAYTVTKKNLILDEHPRYLVPLRAVTFSGLNSIVEMIEDETDFIPFSDIKQYFMVGVLWIDDVDEVDLPIKGEKLLASFDFKEDILRCVHIELLPRRELEYVNLDNLLLFRKTVNNLINMKD